jgi:hypothetical protein
MVLSVPANTYAALQAARGGVLLPRYYVTITGKDRSDGTLQTICLWNGNTAKTVGVVRPDNGVVENRVFQPLAGRMTIPPIPMEMSLKVQSVQIGFFRLSPAVINAVRVFNPRKQSIQIHRGLLDKDSRKLVDPPICILDGIVNRAPIDKGTVDKDGKANNDGQVKIEAVSHAFWLTIASGLKMDAHFFEGRGDQAGKYISTIWRVPIPWGQTTIVHPDSSKKKEHFFR